MSNQTRISAIDLAAQIDKEKPEIGSNPGGGEHTSRIMSTLQRIATKRGFQAQATNLKGTREELSHEFLVDMVWWKDDAQERHEGIVLAVESEKDPKLGERVKDFRKLLAVKSPLKLMIAIEHQGDDETQELVTRLNEVVDTWKQHDPREEYLLYVFAAPHNKHFVSRVQRDCTATKFADPAVEALLGGE